MFRNTVTANNKYPFRDFENMSSPIQMQVSLNPKTFSDPFVPFLDSTSNFKHFEKKVYRHSYFISEKRRLKRRFRAPLDIQHVKGFHTLVKSSGEHLHHIFPSL